MPKLCCGCLGNGTSFWRSGKEDYLAHIAVNGSITWRKTKFNTEEKNFIEQYAEKQKAKYVLYTERLTINEKNHRLWLKGEITLEEKKNRWLPLKECYPYSGQNPYKK